jgi:excisionase family DNA binding protein
MSLHVAENFDHEILGMRRSISLATAAEVLSCDQSTVRRLLSEGLIEGHRIGSRHIRIYADSIDEYRNMNKIVPVHIEKQRTSPAFHSAAHRQAMESLRKKGIIC